MARPSKQGLEYFPYDCMFDEKVKIIDATFPDNGIRLLSLLWQSIYSDEGYFRDWNERDIILFSHSINRSKEIVTEIVKECLNWELFSQEKYDKYKILTSNGIQKRWLIGTAKRTGTCIIKEYWVNGLPDKKGIEITTLKECNEEQKTLNKDINDSSSVVSSTSNYTSSVVSSDSYEQSKVKESKVKESKVKESNIYAQSDKNPPKPTSPTIITFILQDKTEFEIKQSDIDVWTELYPAVDVMQELRNIKGWSMSNPTKRKTPRGAMRFVNNWLSREQDKGGTHQFRPQQAPIYQQTQNHSGHGQFQDFKTEEDNYEKVPDDVLTNLVEKAKAKLNG